MSQAIHNVIIVGSGPAGWTAAIYSARANLKPILFEGGVPNVPGGQLMITNDVENFPGFPEGITGPELMKNMRAQGERFGVEVITQNVDKINFDVRPFELEAGGESYKAHTVIISTGATAMLLGVPKEDELMASGAGVSACATCDGAFYRDLEVIVVGGGDSAMEEANFLTRFCTKVTVVHRREEFRASKIMIDRAKANPKIYWELNASIVEYITEDKGFGVMKKPQVVGVKLKNTQSGEIKDYKTDGVFIAIGHKPNSSLVKDVLELDGKGYIQTLPGKAATTVEGLFACGDVQDSYYRQAITAAGSGCMASLEAERYLESKGL